MAEEIVDFSGSRVGRYEVLTLLGRGGMGAVYDAVDPTLGRHVALKILPTHLAGDAQRLARFVQEARAASALNHPNVVAVYEIGEDHGDGREVHFIAMEKVDGPDLRAALAGTRLAPERAIELVAQVADAVAGAHAAGIIHRDLKPENIVLTRSGLPKVLDFGLAKLRPEEESLSDDGATALRSTDSGMILGTVGYMSPEQAQGRPADHRSDIFSLGCILYEAVAGRRAFAGASAVETLNAIIQSEPPALRESSATAPAELQRIVSKAMAKSPDERYQSAKEMVIDLRAMLRSSAGVPAGATPGATKRTAIAAGALLAAVLTLVAVALALRSRREAPAVATRPAPTLSMRRITARGTVIHAAISPDGRFVAFALLDRTIRLRQLASGEEIEIARVDPLVFWGLTFTPDGNSIVYVARNEQSGLASCFRVSTIGGRPEHLFDGIDSAPSISPDGRRVAWARAEYPKAGESALMVANLDGSDAHAVAVRRPPDRFAPLFFSGPSWSPDGAWIAAPVQRTAEPRAWRLILIDSKNGAERVLVQGWKIITQAQWLADGSGLVTVASRESEDIVRMQVWLIAYPSGAPRPITTEVAAYRGVSLAAQQDLLVSIMVENNSQIWAVPLDGSTTPEKISTGRFDGFRGLAMTADGRIVFNSIEDQGQTLVVSNRDGSGRTRLTRDGFGNQYPVSFRDGIAYVSSTPRGTELCVVDLEGEGRRVVVRDVDTAPIAVSPDGAVVIFSRNRRLFKMPLRGGDATPLVDAVSFAPSFSPNGDRVAVLLGDPDTYAARLGVIAADGRVSWSTPLGGVHAGSAIRWMPDASGLIVNGSPEGVTDDRNLWLFPFKGKPRRLTSFSDQRAYFPELTPDGKTLIVARANLTRDAVMMSGFR
jgi:Tol biopolymer transport system component